MVCRLMRQLLAVYKYNIKPSNIYSMYKMCTDNNKIRLLQHERASNSQYLDLAMTRTHLAISVNQRVAMAQQKYHFITQSSNSEMSQHMRLRHFSTSHALLCNSATYETAHTPSHQNTASSLKPDYKTHRHLL